MRPKPRTKPPEERRDELMSAAQRLFLERGVAPTTIEQITAAAEVAKGTFYLYFTSKEDILAALQKRFTQELLARIQASMAAEPVADWPGKLAAWARGALAGYLDSIRLHDIIFLTPPAPPGAGATDNPIVDHLSELLQAGGEQGAWSLEDVRATAVFLFSGLHGVVDDAHRQGHDRKLQRGRLSSRMERMFLKAMGQPVTPEPHAGPHQPGK